MLEKFTMAPPDPILGLTEAFLKDPNSEKINLGVGVYKDNFNKTPIFNTVKKAEAILLEKEQTKSYLPISGLPDFCNEVQKLVLGADNLLIQNKRVATVQTAGGTSALRIFADLIRMNIGSKKIWISKPTWENHAKIFQSAGFLVETYPYYNPETHGLAWERMLDTIKQIPEGDILLLHGCCHNPTGIDLNKNQWKEIALILKERNILPLIDFAYQGLGDGLEEDALGVRIVADVVPEVFICSSFSKNFGLYNERCGALIVVCSDSDTTQKVLSQIKVVIRTNYSNPPAHGAYIVHTILSSEELRKEWEQEVKEMCVRIKTMRKLLVDKLKEKGVNQDFGFIERQKGMFSFSGLTEEQVLRLREKFSIYIVNSGRINVAGITTNNIDRLVEAIYSVI
ncbi:MAG TPA: amino acid aminotransferase [Candidatus Hydrogenedens sp.]|nr:amino acid aminotransferase [Candidatus Hydrogenedens sp.]HOL20469.1 amino acid aminotransferase [Candidatus Hydrogenedens sp.]HPP57684.1 amino acid aminotransferase [Candidatus Hydrogenedens sp.]